MTIACRKYLGVNRKKASTIVCLCVYNFYLPKTKFIPSVHSSVLFIISAKKNLFFPCMLPHFCSVRYNY